MSKLSFAELAKKADLIVSNDLLHTIAGGASNYSDCHTDLCHALDTAEPVRSEPVRSASSPVSRG